MTTATQQPYNNRVLVSLPPLEINRLAPHLSPVTLKMNRTLHSPGQVADTVYFWNRAVTMENGGTVEVGIIGCDAFVGVPALLGAGHSPNRSFMQIPGHGFKVKASVFLEQSEVSSELKLCLQRGIQGLLLQTAQTAACNRVHELEERLARWLLMCHDRVRSDQLPITHEFLAMMLGTRRTTVTVAAGILHKAGLIACTRGRVTIQNFEGLENTACECYRIIHDEYVRLGLFQP